MNPHVLYIIDALCDWAGAENALLRTTRLLPESGFRCSIATFRTHPALGGTGRFPCPVHVLPLERCLSLAGWRAACALAVIIRRERVRIVHTLFETSDLFGALVARLSGCRLIVSGRRDMGILRRPLHARLYRWARPLYRQVHAVSEEVRRFHIAADGLEPGRVLSIPNGLDLEEIDREGSGAPTPEQPGPRILTVGHVRRVKGLETLLYAAAEVCRHFPEARFQIAGGLYEEDYLAELRALVESRGLRPNVAFLGFRSDVPGLLRQADIFCLLSRSEGFSNALLEAMACRRPCLATRVGGNPELVVPGETGRLVEAGDWQGAAQVLLQWLRNPGQARRLGETGRRRVEEHFAARSVTAALGRAYRELLQEEASAC